MTWIRVDEILDALLPPHCALCGQSIHERPVCPGCLADLPWIEHRCQRCGAPLPQGVDHALARSPAGASCGRCPATLAGFEQVWAALAYEYPVDRLIAAAKFGRKLPAALALGELLALRAPQDTPPPDLVVPIPLHWKRQAERGFNQAEEIARGVCRTLGWRLAADVCRRVRATPEQSALGAAERRLNLRAAFVARPTRPHARILVIDDVLTTGATAEAMARALRHTGAEQIHLWTVARTMERG